MVNVDKTRSALLENEHELMRAHSHLVSDPRSEVEGLDRAACAGHITDLARLATGAAMEDITAEQWRSWVLDALGEQGQPVLEAAETCMRSNGLWPWP